jgi:uncharacterized protein YoxC
LLFSDNFSEGDRQRPAYWQAIAAPSGGFWVVENGRLASGPGQEISGDGYTYAIINAAGTGTWSNYAIATNFSMQSRNGRVVLVGRWTDARNHYRAYLQVFRQSQSAYIEAVQNGTPRTVAYGVSGVGVTIPPVRVGTPEANHYMELRMVGDRLALYVDGRLVIEGRDRTFSRGTAGVGVWYASTYFDNVAVEPVTAITAWASGGRALPDQATIAAQPRAVPQAALAPLTLVVGQFQSRAQADARKQALDGAGYYGAQIWQKSDGFTVTLGDFATREDAEAYRKELETHNQSVLDIIARSPREALAAAPITPGSISEAIRQSPVWSTLTDEQRQQFERLIASGTPPQPDMSQSYSDLKKAIEEVRTDTRKQIAQVVSDLEQRQASKQGQMSVLFKKANDAVEADKFNEARSLLSQVYAIDPGNSMVDLLKQQIDLREKAVALEKGATETSDQVKQLASDSTQIAQRVGGLDESLNQTRTTVDTGFKKVEGQVGQIRLNVNDVTDRHQKLSDKYSKEAKIYMAGIAGLAGLLALFFLWIFFGVRRRNRQLLEQMRSLTLQPMMEIAGGGVATAGVLPDKSEKRSKRVLGNKPPAAPSLDQELFAPAQDVNLLPPVEPAPSKPASKAASRAPKGGNDGGASPLIPTPVAEPEEEFSFMDQQEKPKARPLTVTPSRLEPESDVSLRLTEESPNREADEEEEVDADPFAMFGPPREKSRPAVTPKKPAPSSAAPEPVRTFAMSSEEEHEEESSAMDVQAAGPKRVTHMAGSAAQPEPEMAPLQLDEFDFENVPTARIETPVEAEFEPFDLAEAQTHQTGPAPAPAAPSRFSTLELDDFDTQPVGAGVREESLEFSREEETTQRIMPAVSDERTRPFDFEEEQTQKIYGMQSPEGPALDLDLMGSELPAGAAPETPAALSDVFFEQTFDTEALGAMPEGWGGSEPRYSFATLTVSNDTPAPGSMRCMRFSKDEGTGSAYYSCRFPDATGQVVIEFDLRCDRKNKFLLGFYIEKDGDFRESIHTIINQPDAQGAASLRMQGETVPYQIGTWRRIKYAVNLSTGRLSGFVDGQMVIENIRLMNCPRVLNTLSIRDNIPTTGTLLIDNVKVSRG